MSDQYSHGIDVSSDEEPYIGESTMAIIAKETKSDFKIAAEGTHVARCYQLVDLGIQSSNYGDKHKVLVGWELPNEPMEDGRPMVVSARYTLSLSEKAILRQHLETWRGRKFTQAELAGFDLENIVGKECMVTITHNTPAERTYANVSAVTAIPKGIECPEAVNPTMVWNSSDPIDGLPDWLQKVVNVPATSEEPPMEDFVDDDIPF